MKKILLFVCCLCLSAFCFTPFVNCCFPELEHGGWCVLVAGEVAPVYVAARVTPVRGDGDVANFGEELLRRWEGTPDFDRIRAGVLADRHFPNREFQEARDAGEYVCWLATPYAFYEVDPCRCLDNPPDGIGCSAISGTLCLRFRQFEGGNSFEVRTLTGRPVSCSNCALYGIMCVIPEELLPHGQQAPLWRYISWDNLEPRIRDILQGQVRRIVDQMPNLRAENQDPSAIIMSSPVY